ncbi:MAG: lactate racemase domain-containing protein, partial [Candidatus Bathyarchaeia archaeon]
KGRLKLSIPTDNLQTVITRHPVPALGRLEEAVRDAVNNPIGTPKLTDMAKRGDKVTFLSGPYPYAPVVGPVILDELNRAGVRDEDVTLVVAVGTHLHSEEGNRKTLGPVMERVGRTVLFDSVKREDLRFVGVTGYGNPTWVSKYMAESDLNIGIGDITPGLYGLRGGAKIVSPGCAGFETIGYNHRLIMSPTAKPGDVNNPINLDMEESARLAQLDMKVDLVHNGGSGPNAGYAGVFAGDFVKEKRAALSLVKQVFGTKMDEKADIVVLIDQQAAAPADYLFDGIYTRLLFASLAAKEDGIVIPVISAWGGYSAIEHPGMESHPCSMHEANRLARLSLEDLARTLVRNECNVRCGSLVYPHRRVFEERRTFLVTEGISKEEGEKLGLAYITDSFDDAFQKALRERGKDVQIAVHLGEWGAMPLVE